MKEFKVCKEIWENGCKIGYEFYICRFINGCFYVRPEDNPESAWNLIRTVHDNALFDYDDSDCCMPGYYPLKFTDILFNKNTTKAVSSGDTMEILMSDKLDNPVAGYCPRCKAPFHQCYRWILI